MLVLTTLTPPPLRGPPPLKLPCSVRGGFFSRTSGRRGSFFILWHSQAFL